MVAFSSGPAAEAMRAIAADKRDAAYAEGLAIRYPNLAQAFVGSRFMDWPPRHGRLPATPIRLPAK